MAKKAFRLRRATTDDFPIFMQFHASFACDWLMFGFNIQESDYIENDEKDEAEINYFKTFSTYFFDEFNIARFKEYLKWYRIFIIYSSITGTPIGYVKLENFNGKHIIRRWQMDQNYHDKDMLSQILAECEKKRSSKCKELQVIAMSDDAANFLASHGYKAKVRPFFEKVQT